MRAYLKYKDSGICWLGDMPEHWKSQKAKFLFKKMSRPVREGNYFVTCFHDGTVTLGNTHIFNLLSHKKIGYDISFTKPFYKPIPMRTLDEIKADIFAIERDN